MGTVASEGLFLEERERASGDRREASNGHEGEKGPLGRCWELEEGRGEEEEVSSTI